MAVDTLAITTLYNSMFAAHKAHLTTLYTADEIDAELYAKALASLMDSTMKLATSTVQQQPVLDSQIAKTEADTAFVGTQDSELTNSVDYNNKIKALDAYGDMIGTLGAGSLTIPADMWTALFNMIGGLNTDMGTVPVMLDPGTGNEVVKLT